MMRHYQQQDDLSTVEGEYEGCTEPSDPPSLTLRTAAQLCIKEGGGGK